jgi:phospholipase A1
VYVTLPTSKNLDKEYGLKGIRAGFLHESNGQDGLQSRSWNRLYIASIWQYKNLFTNLRVWYRIPEDKKADPHDANGDDNPYIEEYFGHGDVTFSYIQDRAHFTLMLRNNLRLEDNKGAVELSYSYPLALAKDTFIYLKFFNGYGESLIEYDRHITKASLGFSFSRGLF